MSYPPDRRRHFALYLDHPRLSSHPSRRHRPPGTLLCVSLRDRRRFRKPSSASRSSQGCELGTMDTLYTHCGSGLSTRGPRPVIESEPESIEEGLCSQCHQGGESQNHGRTRSLHTIRPSRRVLGYSERVDVGPAPNPHPTDWTRGDRPGEPRLGGEREDPPMSVSLMLRGPRPVLMSPGGSRMVRSVPPIPSLRLVSYLMVMSIRGRPASKDGRRE